MYLHLSQHVRQKERQHQNAHSGREHQRRFFARTFPFFEDYTPEIAEYHVERHQYAPRESEHKRRIREVTLAHAQPEELRIPQHPGQSAENHVVGQYVSAQVIAAVLFFMFWNMQ